MRAKILVTGGSGFIGTNLIEHLIAQGHHVANLDIVPPRNKNLTPYWVGCDILDREKLKNHFKEIAPDFVVHLAARTDLQGAAIEDYKVNTDGTLNIIEAVNATISIKKVLFASSMLVCRAGHLPASDDDYCPATVYGQSKVRMEQIIRSNSMKAIWVIFRPTSIWGPWFDKPYRDFFDMVQSGSFFGIRKCGSKTYGYVGNSVYQISKLLLADPEEISKCIFYLGDKDPININIWAAEVSAAFGLPAPKILPYHLMYTVALLGTLLSFLKIQFPLTTFRFKNMTTDNILPLENLYKVVGNPPYSRDEGINKTIFWLKYNRS